MLIEFAEVKFISSDIFRSKNTRPPGPDRRLYERVFLVRRWKHLLPDAAPWFGGVAKAKLQSAEPAYLDTFAAETRRGEFSHWLQLILEIASAARHPLAKERPAE